MTDDRAVSRRAVLERLAATSDVDGGNTTTADALAATLDADEQMVATHLAGLTACDLARQNDDGRVRVTITGKELLELDADGAIVVDFGGPEAEN